MYVDESDARLNSYDMIIGRDLLHELGIDLLYSLAMQCNAMQCNAMQCNAMQCNALHWLLGCPNRAERFYSDDLSKVLLSGFPASFSIWCLGRKPQNWPIFTNVLPVRLLCLSFPEVRSWAVIKVTSMSTRGRGFLRSPVSGFLFESEDIILITVCCIICTRCPPEVHLGSPRKSFILTRPRCGADLIYRCEYCSTGLAGQCDSSQDNLYAHGLTCL
jgi:hypothetical protein